MAERRVAAIVLSDLLCELAAARHVASPKPNGGHRRLVSELPFAVVFSEETLGREVPGQVSPGQMSLGLCVGSEGNASGQEARVSLESQRRLVAVNRRAARFGVRQGQSVAEATSIVGDLRIFEQSRESVERALLSVAEAMLSFGPSIDVEFPDTVWVEVSGLDQLFDAPKVECVRVEGREARLASEVATRVRELGHDARVAIASGPRLARAFARFGEALPSDHGCEGEPGVWVVPTAENRRAVERLPITALPTKAERVVWLAKLGLMSIGDLQRLPTHELAMRVGEGAACVLDFVQGKDAACFKTCELPSRLEEHMSWDEPLDGVEPLLFAARRLTTRLGARLLGRGLGVQCLKLQVRGDVSIAKLRGVAADSTCELRFAKPLSNTRDLQRIVSTKLQAFELRAPSIGLVLEALQSSASRPEQLLISSRGSAGRSESNIAVLCAELSADIGSDRVGLLRVEKSFRPERQSTLVPWSVRNALREPKKRKQVQGRLETGRRYGAPNTPGSLGSKREPTKLLDPPVELKARLELGGLLPVAHEVYLIERIEFAYRLDMLDWRDTEKISRDYLCLKLKGAQGYIDALAYVDRRQGRRFLQAVFD